MTADPTGLAVPTHSAAGPAGEGRSTLPPALIRRMLMLAWHLARSNPLSARVTLGLNADCAALIAVRSLSDLDRLAESRPLWIRPRWERQSGVWRQLLEAALSDEFSRLRPLQLRGLQLLAAGFTAAAGRESLHGT